MKAADRTALWQRLAGAGLTSGDVPAQEEAPTPWAVRLMLGAAGWIGAVFLLGFVGAAFAFVFRSEGAALPVGLMCCTAAYAIFRGVPRNEFVAQFGFAVSLAGQALAAYGFMRMAGWRLPAPGFFSIAVFQALLALALPNVVHRTWCTLTACIALQFGCSATGAWGVPTAVAAAGTALIWLNELALARRASLWRPIGYGFAIALLHFDASMIWGHELSRLLLPRAGASEPLRILFWAGPAVTGALFVYSARRLLDRIGVAAGSGIGVAVLGVCCLIALFGLLAPGICAALLVMVLGFSAGNRVLMGLGILAGLGYLSHFYYALDLTLLVKSAVLAGSGLTLLGVRFALSRLLPAEGASRA